MRKDGCGMKGLAKGRVSKAALLGILFFAAGCGSKDEESPPNYVVREVHTGTTVQGSQGVTQPPQDEDTGQASLGNSSIVREEVAEGFGAESEHRTVDEESEPDGSDTDKKTSKDTGEGQALPDETADTEDADLSQAGPDHTGDEDGDTDTGQASLDGTPPVNTDKAERVNVMSVDGMSLLPAGTVVDIAAFSEDELAACFYFEDISDVVFERMDGNSYGENCAVGLSELCYVRVLHYGFDGEVHIGELVVNRAVAQDIKEIFMELFEAEYPIEKMLLVDAYGGDDNASMIDNNTSSFNFRRAEGMASLSKHAYGLAVDINPLYNPYIPIREGEQAVLPPDAAIYADREADCEYYIRHGDVCYEAFVSRGFTWGGDWTAGKDYQHFSKTVE